MSNRIDGLIIGEVWVKDVDRVKNEVLDFLGPISQSTKMHISLLQA